MSIVQARTAYQIRYYITYLLLSPHIEVVWRIINKALELTLSVTEIIIVNIKHSKSDSYGSLLSTCQDRGYLFASSLPFSLEILQKFVNEAKLA